LTDDPAPGCACGEGKAAADSREPPKPRWARGCEGLPKISGLCDNLGLRLGVMLFPGTSQERSISSRSLALSFFRVLHAVFAVQSAAFERVDIAECAGIGKVELDDIVTGIEWCARVGPQC